MAICQPAYVVVEANQDVTVTVSIATDPTSWTIQAKVRANLGSTALITKTTGSGITTTTTTIVVTFSAANLALAPGAYVWQLERTDSGAVYPITDPSTFRVTAGEGDEYPQLTNLSDYLAFAEESETVTDAAAKCLLSYIAGAETSLRHWCGRQFAYDQYTEYPIATWHDKLMLTETPVATTDMDIRVDYERGFGTDTELTVEDDYFLDLDKADGKSHNGIVYRIGSVWRGISYRPPGQLSYTKRPMRGYIKAVYYGGYTLTPDDIKVAVFQIVKQRLAVRQLGLALMSESGMQYSYSRGPYDDEARQIGSVQDVINRYKRGDTLIG